MTEDRVLEARLRKLEERQADMVHKADLRELIEEWRETAEEIAHPEESVNALNACANQLEELL